LESPEELWDRIRESDAEIESLTVQNAKLGADLDALQRRLRGAGDLTDDELMAELPPRMTRNLAAAQEVANDMIERARNDAMLIRLNADQVATQLLDGAEAEVDRIVRTTITESQAQMAAARTKSKDLLRDAHAQRSRILADLDGRAARVEQEYQSLADHRHRLEQAYVQVAATLAAAREALGTGGGPAPAVASERAPAPRPPAAARERPARPPVAANRPAEKPEKPEKAEKAEKAPEPTGRVAGGRRAGVFDWSRAITIPRAGGRPPASGPTVGDEPYAGADAAAV
jgi:cell division septum initiation protein DivIVA